MLIKICFVPCGYVHIVFDIGCDLGIPQQTSIIAIFLLRFTLSKLIFIFLISAHLLENLIDGGLLILVFPELPNSLVLIVFSFFPIMFCIFKRIVAIQRSHDKVKSLQHDFGLVHFMLERLNFINMILAWSTSFFSCCTFCMVQTSLISLFYVMERFTSGSLKLIFYF